MADWAELFKKIAHRNRIRKLRRIKRQGVNPVELASDLKEARRWLLVYAKTYSFNMLCALFHAIWTQYVFFGFKAPELLQEEFGVGFLTAIENIVVLSLIFLWFTHCRWGKWLLSVPVLCMVAVMPLREMLGEALLTPQNIDTLLTTNAEEAAGFFSTLPLLWFVTPLIMFGVGLFLTSKSKPFIDPNTQSRHRLLVVVLPILGLLVFAIGGMNYLTGQLDRPVASIKWMPVSEIPNHKKVDNYVVVIGESLRTDALSRFGQHYATTLYLDRVPTHGVRMIAPSFSTMEAVPRMLALTELNHQEVTREGLTAEVESENNILNLAKSVGFKTYWLSAQMRTGSKNLPISMIARSADEVRFVKQFDDFALLTSLEEILDKEKGGRRLFVLHTYGSHENVCDRVRALGKPYQTGKGQLLDCYLASAHKMDSLLKRIVNAFKTRNESYSLIYLSDHAVDFKHERDAVISARDPKSQKQYEVPFIELGDTVTESKTAVEERSSMRFTSYFPTWIGVTTNLTPAGWDVFNAPDETLYVVDQHRKLVRFDNLDPGLSLNVLLGHCGGL